ncbi:MAG: glycosyltransferase 87 family protein, partial [Actinomycetota bacterium]
MTARPDSSSSKSAASESGPPAGVALWPVMAVTAVVLLLGFGLKAQCLDAFGGFDGDQYERLCYNDLQPLFAVRGLESDTFPYVDGALRDGDFVGGAIEYPVLTGLFLWATGLLVDDGNAFLVVSSLLLAPFALTAAYLLARMSGARALMWAAAPALALYAFHNWDLLAVAVSVGGFYAWWRGRSLLAAVLFGVGAALKMYPLLFVGPLVLEHVAGREWRKAVRDAIAGAGTVALINLPFALANFDGWFATYEFHRQRSPNFDTMWQFGWPTWTPDRFNSVTTVLLLVGFGMVLLAGWRLRSRFGGAYPVLQASGALLAVFLLLNKVHSPQYTLWILPLFVLLRVRVW